MLDGPGMHTGWYRDILLFLRVVGRVKIFFKTDLGSPARFPCEMFLNASDDHVIDSLIWQLAAYFLLLFHEGVELVFDRVLVTTVS